MTDLLINGQTMYIGNKQGSLMKFHIAPTVADPVATIETIARERSNFSRPRNRKTSAGILTATDSGTV